MTTRKNRSSTFRNTVEECLKQYSRPEWLSEHSPLAAPYLLGRILEIAEDDNHARGHALQRVLQQAAARITGKYAERSQRLLREYYFRSRSVVAVCDELNLGRDAFHTSRKRAIDSLVEVLTETLQPALTVEIAPRTTVALFERTVALHAVLDGLRTNRTVSILGGSGSGKTTLGSQIAKQWDSQPVFWYTIRPGFNDYLDSFLFHLAHFLRGLSAPILWQELTTTTAPINLDIVSGIVRHALLQCDTARPLICLDEADCLRPAERGDHVQWIALLQAIRGVAPILLMGQQPRLEADQELTLANLSARATGNLLQAAQIRLNAVEHQQLFAYTDGNPRLLHLFVTLHRIGESLPVLLRQLSGMPSLELLLTRILQRLSEVERGLLMEIAICRNGAPTDAWLGAVYGQALQSLQQMALLQGDGFGKVWLLPAYATALEEALPTEKRQSLHAKVGQLFAARGQYTTAVHHFAQSSRPEEAIWLWRNYQQQEINQGQTSRALHIFRNLPTAGLTAKTQEQLALICARLERTVGNAPQAQADLRSLLFKTPILAIEAEGLAGIIANDQGEFFTAEEHFQRGLAQAEQLVGVQVAHLHKGLAWRYMGEKQLDAAREHAQLAHYELENLMGLLQEEDCHYAQAEIHYLAALDLAQSLDHVEGMAKTHNNLVLLYARQGKFAAAQHHWRSADNHYQQVGRTLALAGSQLNLGMISNLAGEYQAALHAAQAALAVLTERNVVPTSRFQAYVHQAMTEAHWGLHELSAAEKAVAAAIAAEEISLLPDAYRTYSEILLDKGETHDAQRYIKEAIALSRHNQDRYLEAYAWRAAGKIHHAGHEPVQAQAAFQQAMQLFTVLQLPHECTKTQQCRRYML